MESAEIEAIKSRFYTLPAPTAAEIGALMVDLGDVTCKCDNLERKKSIIDFMNEVGVTSMEKNEVGEYTYPAVIAEVRVRDGIKVRDGIACIAPVCLCEAIKQLSEENPELSSHVRVPVMPLKRAYDLTKPSDDLELKAMIAGICRGEGNREIIKVFIKYYIIKKATEDPKFKEKIIDWFNSPAERLPHGLVKELLEYLHDLGINVREWTIKDALYGLRLSSSNEILEILGIEVKGSSANINCVEYDYVQSSLKKLSITDMGTAQKYTEVLCMLTEGELKALLNIAENTECGGRLKVLFERGASADDLRGLIGECSDKSASEGEETKASQTGGTKVVEVSKPEVKVRERIEEPVKAEEGEARFELRPRTLVDIEVRCVGPNADEDDRCKAVKAFVDFALGRSPPDKFLELFDAIAPTKFVEPTGSDFKGIKGTINKLLRAYGVKHVEQITDLYTREGPNKLLNNALGGDFQSLIEYLKLVVEKVMGNANGESREALRNLHTILSNIAQLSPGALNEYAWVLIDATNAIKGRYSWGTFLVDLATQLNLDPEEVCIRLAEAGRRKRGKGGTPY
jgi:hypothetical protein